MPDAPPPQGPRGRVPGPADGADLWGPATAVRAGSVGSAGAVRAGSAGQVRDPGLGSPGPTGTPRPPLTYRSPIPDGTHRRGGARTLDRPDDETREPAAGSYATPAEPDQRGLRGWAALLLLLVIAGIGGLIDSLSGAQIRGGFNIAIIVASIVAILAVKRSAMFPVVVAPPLVYAGASGMMLYLRSGGLNDRKVLFDAAANWLVYGFPAIAAATAAVLIIAGIRMVVRR